MTQEDFVVMLAPRWNIFAGFVAFRTVSCTRCVGVGVGVGVGVCVCVRPSEGNQCLYTVFCISAELGWPPDEHRVVSCWTLSFCHTERMKVTGQRCSSISNHSSR